MLSLVNKFNNNLDLINSARRFAMDPPPAALLTTTIIMLNTWTETDAEDMGLYFVNMFISRLGNPTGGL